MAKGWLGPLAGAFGLWLLAAVMWLPIIKATQLRRRVARWPTARLAVNYLLLVGLGVVGETAVFLAPAIITGNLGGTALVQWALGVAVGYPLGLVGILAVAGPVVTDWEPATEAGLDGRLVLLITGLAYGLATAALAGFVFVVLLFLYFPG